MNRLKHCCLLAALFAGLSLPLFAETAPVTPEEDDPDVTVVVTAEQAIRPISESIASATVITAGELREQGALTVADAIRLVPGVTIKQNGQFGALAVPSIRGTESNQTLLLLDGVRLSSSAFIASNDLAKIPVEDIARIEVIRGPVSSLYGSEAIGGVINIITKRPTVKGGSATLGFGGNGRTERAFSVHGDSTDTIGWRISGSFPAYDGTRPNSDYQATELSAKLLFPELAGWGLALYGETYSDSLGLPGTDPEGTGYFNPSDRQKWRRQNINLSGNRDLDGGQLTARLSYINQELDNASVGFDYITSLPAVYGSFVAGITRAAEGSYAWTRGKHELVGGAEYRSEDYDNVERQDGAVTSTQDESIDNLGIFLQDRWTLSPRSSVVYGARLDDHSTAGSHVTPRVALTRLLQPGMNLRASYAEGFRAPALIELYYNAFGLIGNPNLRPETSRQYEIGVNWQLSKSTLDLAVFTNRVRDQIIWSGATFQNVTRARQQGVEIAWDTRFGRKTSLGLSYGYLDAINETTGARLLRRPRNQVKLSASHRIDLWNVALSGRWTDARPDIGGYDPITYAPITISLPGSAVFDLTVERDAPGVVRPFVTIRNLTNTTYQEVAGYPTEGRTFETGLRASW